MTDLIERLNEAWRKLYGDGDEHDVCDTLAEAIAALEAAREDAERYRWLRDEDGLVCLPYDDHGIGPEYPSHEELDAAIDQARGKGVADA